MEENLEIFKRIEEKCRPLVAYSSMKPSNDGEQLRGIVLVHIDVGHLPVQRAEQFIERYKQVMEPVFKGLPPCYRVLFVPERDRGHSIEFIDIPDPYNSK